MATNLVQSQRHDAIGLLVESLANVAVRTSRDLCILLIVYNQQSEMFYRKITHKEPVVGLLG